MAIWTEPLNVHLELSSRSYKSNIDTVGPSYMFYMEDGKPHTQGKGCQGVCRRGFDLILSIYWLSY